MLMLDAIDLGVLQLYGSKIKRYNRMFGEKCWLQLYQTDVRARCEQADRINRTLVGEYMKAQAAGTSCSYNPARPWNAVYAALIKDQHFWNEEFEKPAQNILTKLANPSSSLGGDAPVGPDVHMVPDIRLGGPNANNNNRRAQNDRRQQPAPRPPKQVPQGKVNRVVDGHYTHNRKEKKLCNAFQSGTCTNANCSFAHQCSVCLQTSHGAFHPSPCNASPPDPNRTFPPNRKGRKGGRGKGGGKGKNY